MVIGSISEYMTIIRPFLFMSRLNIILRINSPYFFNIHRFILFLELLFMILHIFFIFIVEILVFIRLFIEL